MEKGRICKICNKRFANGKAMGGHMRSHLAMAKLPFPPKQRLPPLPPSPPQQLSNSSELSPFSSPPRNTRFSKTNAATMHMKSSLPRLLNPEPSLDSSETESCAKNPTRRRSKRRRKMMMVKAVVEPPPPQPFEAEQQVSSVSDSDDISSTEDGAMCLIMLSRDTWDRPKQVKKEVVDSFEAEAEAKEEEEEKKEEGEEDSPSRARVLTRARTEAKFKCETCNKLFHSYQALGGHRASHKRMKNPEVLDEDEDFKVEEEEGGDDAANGNGNGNGNANGNDNDNGNLVVEHETKTIECPFCFKLFDSAQALGRHTKVHYRTDVGNARLSSSYANFKDNLVIDLNLPAPEAEEEEEEEEEVSQVEFPTVSE